MDLTKRNKSKNRCNGYEFLRSTEERTTRDRIKNEIISQETGLQNLIELGDYNGLVGHIK
jgi:hypothetical protein